MTLNTQHWQSVRHGEFVVGAWPLKIGQRQLLPGERVRKQDLVRVLQPLFELNRIVPVDPVQPSVKSTISDRKTKKRKRK